MRNIAAKRGDFILFGLFMRADALGRWDLVVSATWLGEEKLADLRDLARLLSEELGEDQLKQFSRIVILDTSDPALNAVLSAISVEDGEVRVQQSNFFGLQIEDALILRAKRAA